MSTSKQKHYGFDLDGIGFDFQGGFLPLLAEHAHIEIPSSEEITSYYWYEDIDGLEEDFFWKEFDKFGKSGGYRNLELINDICDYLDAIDYRGHKISYITNRPEYAYNDTVAALEEYAFPQRENLYFAQGNKAPLINSLGVDCFIDDSPRTIEELANETSARIYCLDYPFNKKEKINATRYTRVYTLGEYYAIESKLGPLSGTPSAGAV